MTHSVSGGQKIKLWVGEEFHEVPRIQYGVMQAWEFRGEVYIKQDDTMYHSLEKARDEAELNIGDVVSLFQLDLYTGELKTLMNRQELEESMNQQLAA